MLLMRALVTLRSWWMMAPFLAACRTAVTASSTPASCPRSPYPTTSRWDSMGVKCQVGGSICREMMDLKLELLNLNRNFKSRILADLVFGAKCVERHASVNAYYMHELACIMIMSRKPLDSGYQECGPCDSLRTRSPGHLSQEAGLLWGAHWNLWWQHPV